MRFLLIILNPSGYDNAGPLIPKSRRLSSCYHSSPWSKWIEDFLEPEAPLQFFSTHVYTRRHLANTIRKHGKYHLKIVFPGWRNPFHHLPPTAFPEPFLFIPWLSWWQWARGCDIWTNQIKCTRSNIYSGDCIPILRGLIWQKVGCSWACSLCTSTFLWSSLSSWFRTMRGVSGVILSRFPIFPFHSLGFLPTFSSFSVYQILWVWR